MGSSGSTMPSAGSGLGAGVVGLATVSLIANGGPACRLSDLAGDSFTGATPLARPGFWGAKFVLTEPPIGLVLIPWTLHGMADLFGGLTDGGYVLPY